MDAFRFLPPTLLTVASLSLVAAMPSTLSLSLVPVLLSLILCRSLYLSLPPHRGFPLPSSGHAKYVVPCPCSLVLILCRSLYLSLPSSPSLPSP